MKYLYIGRFQPFHLGHLDAISQALGKGATHITIGLGSVGKINENNPWTAEQRKDMIYDSLAEKGFDQSLFSFEHIPDFPTDLERYSYIIDELPSFDVVMSGNQRVQEIFDSCTHTVFDPEIESKVDIHATQLREWLAEERYDEVRLYLTGAVFDYVSHYKRGSNTGRVD